VVRKPAAPRPPPLPLSAPDDDLRTITAMEAQTLLGIPRSTLGAWQWTRGLVPAEILPDGTHTYRLAHIVALLHGTHRRARHTRPNRKPTPR
jgi:hypothetical protein